MQSAVVVLSYVASAKFVNYPPQKWHIEISLMLIEMKVKFVEIITTASTSVKWYDFRSTEKVEIEKSRVKSDK